MTSFATPYHATLDELVEFVEHWISKYGVFATLVTARPFEAAPIDGDNVRAALERPDVTMIMFTQAEANCSAESKLQLLDKNVGSLILSIGRRGPTGLPESTLSTMNASSVWKRIVRDLKRRTSAGAVGIHERTGATAYYRAHRYTGGAQALARSGISMRQFAETPVIFRFGPPDDTD